MKRAILWPLLISDCKKMFGWSEKKLMQNIQSAAKCRLRFVKTTDENVLKFETVKNFIHFRILCSGTVVIYDGTKGK